MRSPSQPSIFRCHTESHRTRSLQCLFFFLLAVFPLVAILPCSPHICRSVAHHLSRTFLSIFSSVPSPPNISLIAIRLPACFGHITHIISIPYACLAVRNDRYSMASCCVALLLASSNREKEAMEG